nr:hypothetical protein TetV2_00536 [Oceanusvirus sp.]
MGRRQIDEVSSKSAAMLAEEFRLIYKASLAANRKPHLLLREYQDRIAFEIKSLRKSREKREIKFRRVNSKIPRFTAMMNAALREALVSSSIPTSRREQAEARLPGAAEVWHEAMMECARHVWKDPSSMYHGVTEDKRDKNRSSMVLAFRDLVEGVIREAVPENQFAESDSESDSDGDSDDRMSWEPKEEPNEDPEIDDDRESDIVDDDQASEESEAEVIAIGDQETVETAETAETEETEESAESEAEVEDVITVGDPAEESEHDDGTDGTDAYETDPDEVDINSDYEEFGEPEVAEEAAEEEVAEEFLEPEVSEEFAEEFAEEFLEPEVSEEFAEEFLEPEVSEDFEDVPVTDWLDEKESVIDADVITLSPDDDYETPMFRIIEIDNNPGRRRADSSAKKSVVVVKSPSRKP